MTFHDKSLPDRPRPDKTVPDGSARPIGYHVDAAAENLIFTVYRCWMAGYETQEVTCWDMAWDALCREMPVDNAKPLYGEFHHFVRTLREASARTIGWRPAACRALCRDECLILAMVDGAQRDRRAQLTTATSHLVGNGDVEAAIGATEALARALARVGLFITPVSANALEVITGPGTA